MSSRFTWGEEAVLRAAERFGRPIKVGELVDALAGRYTRADVLEAWHGLERKGMIVWASRVRHIPLNEPEDYSLALCGREVRSINWYVEVGPDQRPVCTLCLRRDGTDLTKLRRRIATLRYRKHVRDGIPQVDALKLAKEEAGLEPFDVSGVCHAN